jgi:hypothetical protein
MNLEDMRKLEANWDSYGAPPINPRAIDKAYYLIGYLPGAWTPVPCTDGSLQLEHHAGGLSMELRIAVEV